MESIFKKEKEEKIKEELKEKQFDSLLEKGIKTCHLEEDLEMLLYDVADAIQSNQTLLIQAYDQRESGYLIPAILAYQNSKTFQKFVIVTSSDEVKEKIKERVQELSTLLGIPIPVHELNREENYLCIRKLLKQANKSKEEKWKTAATSYEEGNSSYQRDTFPFLSERDWEKIHVSSCLFEKCQFASSCPYKLQYESAFQEGCVIITQSSLIRSQQNSSSHFLARNADLIIIDEATELAMNTQSVYQDEFEYQEMINHLKSISRLLENKGVSTEREKYFIVLRDFFQEIYDGTKEVRWMTPSIQQKAKYLSLFINSLNIHLNRVLMDDHYRGSMEHVSDTLTRFGDFFQDIARRGVSFSYKLVRDETHKEQPGFQKLSILSTPRMDMQRKLTSNMLTKIKCSLVLTDEKISGEQEDYEEFSSSINLSQSRKNIVKEFVYKK